MQSLDATSAEESVDELLEREHLIIPVLPNIKTTAPITEESANPDLYESHVGGFVFFDNSEPMNPVTLVLAYSHEVSQCLPYLNIEANRPPMSSLAFANLTRLRPRKKILFSFLLRIFGMLIHIVQQSKPRSMLHFFFENTEKWFSMVRTIRPQNQSTCGFSKSQLG
jgi:hypothetical protein